MTHVPARHHQNPQQHPSHPASPRTLSALFPPPFLPICPMLFNSLGFQHRQFRSSQEAARSYRWPTGSPGSINKNNCSSRSVLTQDRRWQCLSPLCLARIQRPPGSHQWLSALLQPTSRDRCLQHLQVWETFNSFDLLRWVRAIRTPEQLCTTTAAAAEETSLYRDHATTASTG